MKEFSSHGFKLAGVKKLQAYVRKGTSQRAVILISGFNQPAKSWLNTINESVSGDHTVAIIIRRNEASAPGRFLGLQSIYSQKKEVVDTILRLKDNELKDLNLTIVGHSVGALLARHCLSHRQIMDCTDRLVQITPVPLTWRHFTFNRTFWLKGGLIAAPSVLLALLGVTRGVVPPKKSVRGLYSGDIHPEKFNNYCKSLVPDSAFVFLQLLMWYSGTREWRKIRLKWKGENLTIGSPSDATISRRAVKKTWKADKADHDDLHWFAPGTPHCYWLGTGDSHNGNLMRLRSLIEG